LATTSLKLTCRFAPDFTTITLFGENAPAMLSASVPALTVVLPEKSLVPAVLNVTVPVPSCWTAPAPVTVLPKMRLVVRLKFSLPPLLDGDAVAYVDGASGPAASCSDLKSGPAAGDRDAPCRERSRWCCQKQLARVDGRATAVGIRA